MIRIPEEARSKRSPGVCGLVVSALFAPPPWKTHCLRRQSTPAVDLIGWNEKIPGPLELPLCKTLILSLIVSSSFRTLAITAKLQIVANLTSVCARNLAYYLDELLARQ